LLSFVPSPSLLLLSVFFSLPLSFFLSHSLVHIAEYKSIRAFGEGVARAEVCAKGLMLGRGGGTLYKGVFWRCFNSYKNSLRHEARHKPISTKLREEGGHLFLRPAKAVRRGNSTWFLGISKPNSQLLTQNWKALNDVYLFIDLFLSIEVNVCFLLGFVLDMI
jgi:hypothetical protein